MVHTVSISSSRVLVGLMAAVVISFLVATGFAQSRASVIDRRVTDIAGNAMPSIQALLRANSALERELGMLGNLIRHPSPSFGTVREEVSADEQDRKSAFASYRSIPDNGGREPRITLRVLTFRRHMRVEVEDTGPGIEPDKLELIFAPYVRGTTKQPGLGLGLATVKRLVEAHGGRVGVSSMLNQGSVFWFELPTTYSVASHAA